MSELRKWNATYLLYETLLASISWGTPYTRFDQYILLVRSAQRVRLARIGARNNCQSKSPLAFEFLKGTRKEL